MSTREKLRLAVDVLRRLDALIDDKGRLGPGRHKAERAIALEHLTIALAQTRTIFVPRHVKFRYAGDR